MTIDQLRAFVAQTKLVSATGTELDALNKRLAVLNLGLKEQTQMLAKPANFITRILRVFTPLKVVDYATQIEGVEMSIALATSFQKENKAAAWDAATQREVYDFLVAQGVTLPKSVTSFDWMTGRLNGFPRRDLQTAAAKFLAKTDRLANKQPRAPRQGGFGANFTKAQEGINVDAIIAKYRA
jgi:hypothetical protein